MTKTMNLREAVALVGQVTIEGWKDSIPNALPLPSLETVESAIANLKRYAETHSIPVQSLLIFAKDGKRQVKGIHHPTLSRYLDTKKYPTLLKYEFSDGIPPTYNSAYEQYEAQQQALTNLKELLGSEKLEANYTNVTTGQTQPLPASLVRENLVVLDLAKNRIRLDEVEGVLSIPADKLIKLLQSKSVIGTLQAHTPKTSNMAYIPAPNRNSEDYLTPKEAAEKLKMSEKTLAQWRSNGSSKLAYETMKNGRIRYHPDEVKKFIEQRQEKREKN